MEHTLSREAKDAARFAEALPRMMTLAAKMDKLITEFGQHPNGETLSRAYSATYDASVCDGRFAKGYDNAYDAWCDIVERSGAQRPPRFRLGAEHFNAALQAAGIEGLSVQNWRGGLFLDSGDLECQAVIDKLLNGLVSLRYRT